MSVTRLRVPGRYDQLDRIQNFVASAAERSGLSGRAVFHCQLAVDEACTNIIEHGYGGENRGDIQVECRVDGHGLTIELRDSAGRFDPTTMPTPDTSASLEDRMVGGYGIHFIRQVMDHVEYEPLSRGNLLRMVKYLRR